MHIRTEEELEEACSLIAPIMLQLEKMKPKFMEGTPQHTLLIRRLRAFGIATALMKKALRGALPAEQYTQAELKEALRAVQSTLNKSLKVRSKLKEGAPQHTLLLRRIRAFEIAIELIRRELVS